MIARQCAVDGCYAVVLDGSGYCPAHAAIGAGIRARRRERATQSWDRMHARQDADGTRKLWQSARWRKLRREVLDEQPRCFKCHDIATEVHHLVPHGGDPGLFFDRRNLVSLCHDCHLGVSRAQAMERRSEGKWG